MIGLFFQWYSTQTCQDAPHYARYYGSKLTAVLSHGSATAAWVPCVYKYVCCTFKAEW